MQRHLSQSESISAHLTLSPEIARLRSLGRDNLEPDIIEAVIDQAARISSEVLSPLNRACDQVGCTWKDGKVALAPGHQEAWDQFRRAGWLGITMPEEIGGQNLPMSLAVGITEIMDRGSIAFGMLPGSIRGAARLLNQHANKAIKDIWLPRLLAGEWSTTICISEPDAGSDVGRIRTRAVGRGHLWSITGEKIWISYGDHPLTERIGHLVLARTKGPASGTRGLSLFLVPGTTDDGASNGLICHGIEEKMGLHGSPTCALGFDAAEGTLIGEVGRGLPALFTMITGMRMQVAAQGLGIASAICETANQYANDRKQGGNPDEPAISISRHPDVQRMILNMTGNIETLRGLLLAAAAYGDLAELEESEEARNDADNLVRFLLPILKNGAAELAWNSGSEAMLILGGAGYTQDWPVEQWLRDARVLAIFEGTTGMQAQDLVFRRIKGDGRGVALFMQTFEQELEGADPWVVATARDGLDVFKRAVAWINTPDRKHIELEASATLLLRLATLVAQGWIAVRLSTSGAPALGLTARAWLADFPSVARCLFEQAAAQPERLALQ